MWKGAGQIIHTNEPNCCRSKIREVTKTMNIRKISIQASSVLLNTILCSSMTAKRYGGVRKRVITAMMKKQSAIRSSSFIPMNSSTVQCVTMWDFASSLRVEYWVKEESNGYAIPQYYQTDQKEEQEEWKDVDNSSKKIIEFVHTNIAPTKLHVIITKVAHN